MQGKTKQTTEQTETITVDPPDDFQKLLKAPVVIPPPAPKPLEWKKGSSLNYDDQGYYWMKRPDNYMRPEPCKLSWCCSVLYVYVIASETDLAPDVADMEFAKMEVPPK